MANVDILGPATLGITQGMTAFTVFLPKLSEVRKSDAAKNPEMVGDVRLGEIAAATLTIGIGAIVSSLTGSPIPAFVAAVMVIVLIGVYEMALRGERLFEPAATVRSTRA